MNGFVQNDNPAESEAWSEHFTTEVAEAAPDIGAYWRLERPLRPAQDQMADMLADDLLRTAGRAEDAGLYDLGDKLYVRSVAARSQRPNLEPHEVSILLGARAVQGVQPPAVLAYTGAA